MGFNEAAIDRLLPRHELPAPATLEWNVRMEKVGLFKKQEESTRADIVDLSLEGALILVPESEDHEIGDRITVRFHDVVGIAEIRHRRHADHPAKKIFYGVRFLPAGGFHAQLVDAVGTVRGHRAELDQAWARVN